jgi:hypothetical protein
MVDQIGSPPPATNAQGLETSVSLSRRMGLPRALRNYDLRRWQVVFNREWIRVSTPAPPPSGVLQKVTACSRVWALARVQLRISEPGGLNSLRGAGRYLRFSRLG